MKAICLRVLNSENKVSKHLVTPGIQDSQKVVIRAGISPGNRVVTDGIDRLTEGAKVEVVEAREHHHFGRESHQPRIREKGARCLMQVLPPSSTGGPWRLLYYASCGHHAADGGNLIARISVIAPCPFRRCRKWTIRPFRWSRSTQVRARMS